jgi:HEAT repeat protein
MKALAKCFPIAARWVVLFAVLGGLAWLVLRSKEPPEPVYQGKRLSEWLTGYNGSSPETHEALRRMGTNAIPTLLRMLRAKDSKATTWFMGLARKQHVIKFEYTNAYQRNARAALAFDSLGALANEAVPELIEIFEQNISAHSQSYTAWSLGGTRSAKAIPTLLRGTTNTYLATRCNAISALAKIHAEPELVVPALTKFLKDPDRRVRAITITSLALFGSDAKPAVSDLTQSLNDPSVRTLAKYALSQIDPEAAAKLGLTNTLVRTRAGWEVLK